MLCEYYKFYYVNLTNWCDTNHIIACQFVNFFVENWYWLAFSLVSFLFKYEHLYAIPIAIAKGLESDI